MALISCPECGGKVSDQAPACIHCGYPLQNKRNTKYCPYCGKENDVTSEFCCYCGKSFTYTTPSSASSNTSSTIKNVNLVVDTESLELRKLEKERLQAEKDHYTSMARCPKCGSTSLSGDRKGYGVGKAVVGVALLGGAGLLAGEIGANKTVVTCLKCGHKFKL